MPLDFNRRRWALLSGSLGSALALSVCLGTGRVAGRDLVAVFFLSGLSLLLGQALGRILRLPPLPGILGPFEAVGGFCALATIQTAAVFCLNLNAGPALAVSTALTAVVALWAFRRQPSGEENRSDPKSELADAAVLLGLGLLAALWSRQAIVATREMAARSLFDGHQDFFFHAAIVNFLRIHPSFSGHAADLAGLPSFAYHYASYALPGAYCALTAASTMQATTAFWVPAGLVLAGLGTYSLAGAVGGRGAGLLAAGALFLLPDASHYGPANTFFGFEWLLEVCPALGYGVGLSLLGLALFVIGHQRSQFSLTLAGGALVADSIVFKLHTAVPSLILYTFLFLATWKPRRGAYRWAVVSALAAAAFAAALLSERLPNVPHLLTGQHDFRPTFDAVEFWAAPGYAHWYAAHIAHASAATAVPMGLAFMLFAAFGALLPAAILLAFGPRRIRPFWPIACIPFAALGAYAAVIFLIPTPVDSGDSSEFVQRPFVLFYAILVAFIAAGVARLAGRWAERRPGLRPAGLILGCAAGAACLPFAWVWSGHIQQSCWLACMIQMPLPPGEAEAGAYIRDHSAAGDVVLSSDGDPYGVAVALTQRQAFLDRFTLWLKWKGKGNNVVRDRFALGAKLQRMGNYAELREFGARYHVRWFLLQPGEMRNWPRSMLAHCRFQERNCRVFDLASSL